MRIAWTTNGGAEGVHPDCIAATKDAARLCEDLGHRIEEAAPNIDYEELKSAFFMVLEAHTAAFLDGMIDIAGKRATPDNVEPWTWRVAERGRKASAADFAKNKAKLNRATRTLGTFFGKYDVLLTPTLGSPPKRLGSFNTFDLSYDELRQRIFDFCPYTWIHNVAGTPAISVPLHWNKENLPVGVQFATKLAGESTLYGLAGQLERARPWKDRRPPR